MGLVFASVLPLGIIFGILAHIFPPSDNQVTIAWIGLLGWWALCITIVIVWGFTCVTTVLFSRSALGNSVAGVLGQGRR